jgi:hypothetical protein
MINASYLKEMQSYLYHPRSREEEEKEKWKKSHVQGGKKIHDISLINASSVCVCHIGMSVIILG